MNSRYARMRELMRSRGLGVSRSKAGIIYIDPLHAGRHPFQTYILFICALSGIPRALGLDTAGTLARVLPEWLNIAWGIALFGGCMAALIGSYWMGEYVNALTIERVGLIFVGIAALSYGIILTVLVWPTGVFVAAVTIGFGLACLRRALDIAHIIRVAIKSVSS